MRANRFLLVFVFLAVAIPLVLLSLVANVGPQTITIQVMQSSDDCQMNADQTGFTCSEGQPRLGKAENTNGAQSLLRFNDVQLPPGAAIASARLLLSSAGPENLAGVRVRIAACRVPNASAPVSAADFAAKQVNLTAASVEWNELPALEWDQKIESPDLAPVIAEIVSLPGWLSGNSILLWIGDNNSDAWAKRRYMAYEMCPECAKPQLTITYSGSTGGLRAMADVAQTNANALVTIDVLANDVNLGNQPMGIVSLGGAQHGTVRIEHNTLVYVPNTGYSGQDSFTYTIGDASGATSFAAVTVNVLPAGGYYLLNYVINRDRVPTLYYNALTLLLPLPASRQAYVYGDGQRIEYLRLGDHIMFSTAARQLQIFVDRAGGPEQIGALTKATLRDNKKWAWSHSFDDNVYVKAGAEVMNQRGWRGTFYLITNQISDTRQEAWILDVPDIHRYLAQGWSIGNTSDQTDCPRGLPPAEYERRIMNAQNRLQQIVASSPVPSYKVISFAAPCYLGEFDDAIRRLINGRGTVLQFDESGNDYRLIVDSGATDYTRDGKTADAFGPDVIIGRDTALQLGQSGVQTAQGEVNWMAANADGSHHFWYNTFSHGNNEAFVDQLAGYIYQRFGPGGSNEVWVAPADEIYSYLIVRDSVAISDRAVSDHDGNLP